MDAYEAMARKEAAEAMARSVGDDAFPGTTPSAEESGAEEYQEAQGGDTEKKEGGAHINSKGGFTMDAYEAMVRKTAADDNQKLYDVANTRGIINEKYLGGRFEGDSSILNADQSIDWNPVARGNGFADEAEFFDFLKTMGANADPKYFESRPDDVEIFQKEQPPVIQDLLKKLNSAGIKKLSDAQIGAAFRELRKIAGYKQAVSTREKLLLALLGTLAGGTAAVQGRIPGTEGVGPAVQKGVGDIADYWNGTEAGQYLQDTPDLGGVVGDYWKQLIGGAQGGDSEVAFDAEGNPEAVPVNIKQGSVKKISAAQLTAAAKEVRKLAILKQALGRREKLLLALLGTVAGGTGALAAQGRVPGAEGIGDYWQNTDAGQYLQNTPDLGGVVGDYWKDIAGMNSDPAPELGPDDYYRMAEPEEPGFTKNVSPSYFPEELVPPADIPGALRPAPDAPELTPENLKALFTEMDEKERLNPGTLEAVGKTNAERKAREAAAAEKARIEGRSVPEKLLDEAGRVGDYWKNESAPGKYLKDTEDPSGVVGDYWKQILNQIKGLQ